MYFFILKNFGYFPKKSPILKFLWPGEKMEIHGKVNQSEKDAADIGIKIGAGNGEIRSPVPGRC